MMETTPTLLSKLVAASKATASASARNEKVAILAGYLSSVPANEAPTAVALLTGVPRQGRVGIGWATVTSSVADFSSVDPSETREPQLVLSDVDLAVEAIGSAAGTGSAGDRHRILGGLFSLATPDEAEFLSAVLVGGLRHGALGGVLTSAIAKAYGVKLASVRRAAMLLGDLGEAARLAAGQGEDALMSVGIAVGRAVEPMLASTSAGVAEALDDVGMASVEWKLDGIRIQVHRSDSEIRVFSRNLNDITDRTSGVVEAVARLEVQSIILDGEVLGSLPYFFDVLSLDDVDLLESPLSERRSHLERVAGELAIPGIITDDAEAAQRHLDDALAAGHEGVMVKAIDSPYEAGKRGKGWKKVKPVHTLDLVVLGAEWGHGRRKGWLSNLHLGARDGDDFVMVGKTFKGLTDKTLAWQTEQILQRETHRGGITVFARPELVVEIALDSSHTSTRYPGGVALRFARVRAYRDDKDPSQADTLQAVRNLMVTLPVHDLPE